MHVRQFYFFRGVLYLALCLCCNLGNGGIERIFWYRAVLMTDIQVYVKLDTTIKF